MSPLTAPVLNPAGRKIGLHIDFCISRWNVLTLSETGHQVAIVRETNKLKVSITGHKESCMVGGNVVSVQGCSIFHSRGKTHAQGEALFLCTPLVVLALVETDFPSPLIGPSGTLVRIYLSCGVCSK